MNQLLAGLILAVMISPPSIAEENAPSPVTISHPELRQEILRRFKIDQEMRLRSIQSWAELSKLDRQSEKFKQEMEKLQQEFLSVDQENTQWLKGIVEKHGWPRKSLVGEDGARQAWCLVQHADLDASFQQQCLALMEALPEGEVTKKNIAYLTDRVRKNTGKPQLYGTQLDENFQIAGEVEDPEHLNERRARAGLPSIEEYMQSVRELYEAAEKDDSREDVEEKNGEMMP